MNKIVGVSLGAIVAVGLVYLVVGDKTIFMPVQKAADMCAAACKIHEDSRLQDTGEMLNGFQKVECFCKTKDRGWKKNHKYQGLHK